MGNTFPTDGRGGWMAWKETGPVLERVRFIEEYLTGFFTLTELAVRHGVSRKTLHKWLARHDADGMNGLADRSRAPLHTPHATSADTEARIVAFRRRYRFRGPRKIVARLAELYPDHEWPAPSTVGEILKRHDLIV